MKSSYRDAVGTEVEPPSTLFFAARSAQLSNESPADPLIGLRHKNLRIIAVCGEGSLSRVYKAHDVVLDRCVALKMVRAEAPEFAPLMLRREARILSRLAPHPAIVPIYEAGAVEGRAYIALEYLPFSLESILFRHPNGLPIAHAVAIATDIARALGHAHMHGIIHRDVKPGSVLLDNAQRSVRLSDFNLATMLDAATGTASSGPNGTRKYMAPEQRDGLPLTPASDVYALGVMLRELLVGDAADRFGDVPHAVAECVRNATVENQEERYRDGRAFAQALRRAAREAFDSVPDRQEQAT